MKYVGNAFSAGMLQYGCCVRFTFLTLEEAKAWIAENEWQSCVGHADTAVLISAMLGSVISMQRTSTELHSGDELLIAQYNGSRLSEGAVSLPEGAKIRWILAEIEG
jgi:hypothetical protein